MMIVMTTKEKTVAIAKEKNILKTTAGKGILNLNIGTITISIQITLLKKTIIKIAVAEIVIKKLVAIATNT